MAALRMGWTFARVAVMGAGAAHSSTLCQVSYSSKFHHEQIQDFLLEFHLFLLMKGEIQTQKSPTLSFSGRLVDFKINFKNESYQFFLKWFDLEVWLFAACTLCLACRALMAANAASSKASALLSGHLAEVST